MENTSILSTHDLCVGYEKKQILKDINLEFYPGKFISLLGPNGAGKTTLLRTLSKHLLPLGGQVKLHGKDLARIKSDDLARVMSIVLTQRVVPPLFSVYDFVSMGRYPHTKWTGRMDRKDDDAIMEALGLVRADDLIFRDLSNLSDGERQKVFIARALAQEPAIILLDEPTMHLDLKHRMEIMSILQGLCREKRICVVASLHDVEVAAKVSDQVVLIKDGSISAFGPPEDVLQEDIVSDLYEFSNACFNRMLGNIEIRSRADKGRVFVIGGMGSASVLYRLLSRKGYDIVTGVLLRNDIDYFVAKSLGFNCLVQDSLNIISGQSVQNAVEELKACDFVIDTGFEADGLNNANLDLLTTALALEKPIFCMASPGKREMLNRPDLSNVWFTETESRLVDLVEERKSA